MNVSDWVTDWLTITDFERWPDVNDGEADWVIK